MQMTIKISLNEFLFTNISIIEIISCMRIPIRNHPITTAETFITLSGAVITALTWSLDQFINRVPLYTLITINYQVQMRKCQKKENDLTAIDNWNFVFFLSLLIGNIQLLY